MKTPCRRRWHPNASTFLCTHESLISVTVTSGVKIAFSMVSQICHVPEVLQSLRRRPVLLQQEAASGGRLSDRGERWRPLVAQQQPGVRPSARPAHFDTRAAPARAARLVPPSHCASRGFAFERNAHSAKPFSRRASRFGGTGASTGRRGCCALGPGREGAALLPPRPSRNALSSPCRVAPAERPARGTAQRRSGMKRVGVHRPWRSCCCGARLAARPRNRRVLRPCSVCERRSR